MTYHSSCRPIWWSKASCHFSTRMCLKARCTSFLGGNGTLKSGPPIMWTRYVALNDFIACKLTDWIRVEQKRAEHVKLNWFTDESVTKKRTKQLAFKKGDLLIWNSAVIHGSYPNTRSLWRSFVYITYFGADYNNQEALEARLKSYRVRRIRQDWLWIIFELSFFFRLELLLTGSRRAIIFRKWQPQKRTE